MSNPLWRPVPRIVDGVPVNASYTNPPIAAIVANLSLMQAQIDALSSGNGVYAREVRAASTLLVGQPAYFNATTLQFEQALGDATVDSTTGELLTKNTSHVRGIVTARSAAGTVDLLLSGTAELDLSNVISGTPTVGAVYYLSNGTAGRLVEQRPPVGVPVLQVCEETESGVYRVFVNPQFADYLAQHRHYSYGLTCSPAGDTSPPAVDEAHTITAADADVEGWLPADDASFNDLAPVGAKFGYNLAQSSLRHLWPPVPLTSVCIEMVKSDSVAAGLGVTVPLGIDQLCVVDKNGIWWMSDCYGDVPWPTDLDTSVVDSSSAPVGECARDVPMSMKLYFVRQSFIGGSTAVLSLRAAADSGLTVRCADSIDDATTGHLEIGFDQASTVEDTDAAGYQVVKTAENNTLQRGPVVSGVRAGTSNVTVAGAESVTISGNSYAVGPLTISVETDLDDTELSVEIVRLVGVTDEPYQNVLGLNFSTVRANASIRGMIRVPTKAALSDGAMLRLRLWLLGRAAGTVPDDLLTATYRVLARPETPTALPTDDTELPLDVSATLVSANSYYEVTSDPIEVAAGDVVLFTLTRVGSDGYSGDVLLIRRTGVISLE